MQKRGITLEYKEVQQIAKETIEYAKDIIKPGMNLLDIRRLCEEKCWSWEQIPFGIGI